MDFLIKEIFHMMIISILNKGGDQKWVIEINCITDFYISY